MATEIAILPLLGDINLEDSTNAGSQTFQELLHTVTKQEGFQRLYWGQEKGNSSNLRLFIDWDAVEDQIAFTKTVHYPEFMAKLGEVVDLSHSQIWHVNATPYPPVVLSDHVSPVTEILTVYFPSEYSDSDRGKFWEDMNEVFAMVKKQEMYRGSAGMRSCVDKEVHYACKHFEG